FAASSPRVAMRFALFMVALQLCGGGFVDEPEQFAIDGADDLGGKGIDIDGAVEDLVKHVRLAGTVDEEDGFLRRVCEDRTEGDAIGVELVHKMGECQGFRVADGRCAGEKRERVPVVAHAEEDEVEDRDAIVYAA